MSLSFQQRLAADPYFTIHLTEQEKEHPEEYCSISDELIRQENPDSLDVDSIVDAMSQEEFKRHVQEVIAEKRGRERAKKKAKANNEIEVDERQKVLAGA